MADVTIVCPDLAESGKLWLCLIRQEFGSYSIIDVGSGDHNRQQQTQRIHQKMSLSSVDSRVVVVFEFAALWRNFDGLTVGNPSGRL